MDNYEKIYHLCIRENKVPGAAQEHNRQLEKVGATVSLKYRRGPIFKEDAYIASIKRLVYEVVIDKLNEM